MLTVERILLGTSMPTAGLPGMGASIRTPAVARFKAMSSAKLVMRLTLMPAWGCSSYRVTDGPRQMSSMVVLDAEAVQRVDQDVGILLHLAGGTGFVVGAGRVEKVQGRIAVRLHRLGLHGS